MRNKGEKSLDDNAVPVEEGRPIWEAAVRARDAGRRVFTCAVTVAYTSGSGLGLGGKKTTDIRNWDPATLIESIESLGWRLEHVDHVWQQTEHNAALGKVVIKGLTRAQMLFRMSSKGLTMQPDRVSD